MSVRQHLLATLAACFAITVAATLALHLGQRRETDALALNFARERREQLDDAVREQSRNLGLFVEDYSSWDEMVAFASSLDPEWARLNIAEVMERFRLGAVWLVGRDGRVLYTIATPGARNVAPPPLAPIVAARPWANEVGGFYRSGDAVVDLRARPVQPTADLRRVTEPAAWLVAARVLDAETAAQLGRTLQARVSLHPAKSAAESPPDGCIVVHHPLPALFDGAPAAEWHAAFRITALELGEHYNRSEMTVLIGSGLLLFGVVAWSVNRNVLRPLARIGQSLEDDSPAALAGISPACRSFPASQTSSGSPSGNARPCAAKSTNACASAATCTTASSKTSTPPAWASPTASASWRRTRPRPSPASKKPAAPSTSRWTPSAATSPAPSPNTPARSGSPTRA